MGKYITIFLGVIFVGLGIFLAAYLIPQRLAVRSADQQALIDNTLVSRFNDTPTQSRQPAGGMEQLSLGGGSFPQYSSSRDEIRYYNGRTGEVRARSLVGDKKNTVLATIKPDANSISWSDDGTELIAQYQNTNVYYNLATNISKKYDASIHGSIFLPGEHTIAYVFFDPKQGSGSISIADPLLKSFKNILQTRSADWKISGIASGLLALVSPMTSDQTLRTIATLDTDKKWLDTIAQAFGPVETLWSPSANTLIYSYQANNKTITYVADRTTGSAVELALGTDVSKCAWGRTETTLYCAFPENSDSGTGDSLFLVSLNRASIRKTPLSNDPGTIIDAGQLQVINDGSALLFKNFKDGNLYLLHL